MEQQEESDRQESADKVVSTDRVAIKPLKHGATGSGAGSKSL